MSLEINIQIKDQKVVDLFFSIRYNYNYVCFRKSSVYGLWRFNSNFGLSG